MAWKITDLDPGSTPLSGGELFEMVQNGESFSVPVSGFAGLDHNTLSNLQGGIASASEYYHLSQSIHDGLFSASPTIGVGINGALGGNEANMQVDYGNDNVSFYIDAGEGQGYRQVIDIDGDAGSSEINIGLQTETYLKVGIGSNPNIRMISGSDTWFYVSANTQRLGYNGVGGSKVTVSSSGEITMVAGGIEMFSSTYDSGDDILITDIGQTGASHAYIRLNDDQDDPDISIEMIVNNNTMLDISGSSARLGDGSNTSIIAHSGAEEIIMEVVNDNKVVIDENSLHYLDISTVTAETTAYNAQVILASASAAPFTVYLQDSYPDDVGGAEIKVMKVDAVANNVTVQGLLGDINGAANKVISTQYDSATFIWDGTNWFAF